MTWVEACHDKNLQDLPYKVELDHQGKITMSPTRNKHGFYQAEIAFWLRTLMPHGHVLVECAIDTPNGTVVADDTWASKARFKLIENEFSCSVAPEICVEVWSPSNTPEDLKRKRELYLEKGAQEFWYCDEGGGLTFFNAKGPLERSELCPGFPLKVEA